MLDAFFTPVLSTEFWAFFTSLMVVVLQGERLHAYLQDRLVVIRHCVPDVLAAGKMVSGHGVKTGIVGVLGRNVVKTQGRHCW